MGTGSDSGADGSEVGAAVFIDGDMQEWLRVRASVGGQARLQDVVFAPTC